MLVLHYYTKSKQQTVRLYPSGLDEVVVAVSFARGYLARHSDPTRPLLLYSWEDPINYAPVLGVQGVVVCHNWSKHAPLV